MPKAVTQFVCQACGATSIKWLGRCVGCGGWNTLVEERVAGERRSQALGSVGRAARSRCRDVTADRRRAYPPASPSSIACSAAERCSARVVLVGGDPGVGKSTLLLQALAGSRVAACTALYVSGEESAGQTALRARRLGRRSRRTCSCSPTSDLGDGRSGAIQETRAPSARGRLGADHPLRLARVGARARCRSCAR